MVSCLKKTFFVACFACSLFFGESFLVAASRDIVLEWPGTGCLSKKVEQVAFYEQLCSYQGGFPLRVISEWRPRESQYSDEFGQFDVKDVPVLKCATIEAIKLLRKLMSSLSLDVALFSFEYSFSCLLDESGKIKSNICKTDPMDWLVCLICYDSCRAVVSEEVFRRAHYYRRNGLNSESILSKAEDFRQLLSGLVQSIPQEDSLTMQKYFASLCLSFGNGEFVHYPSDVSSQIMPSWMCVRQYPLDLDVDRKILSWSQFCRCINERPIIPTILLYLSLVKIPS